MNNDGELLAHLKNMKRLCAEMIAHNEKARREYEDCLPDEQKSYNNRRDGNKLINGVFLDIKELHDFDADAELTIYLHPTFAKKYMRLVYPSRGVSDLTKLYGYTVVIEDRLVGDWEVRNNE